MAKKPRIVTDDAQLRSHPFAALQGALDQVPEAEPVAVVADEPARTPAVSEPRLPGKIVVRREKKGRGGKTATVIEGIALAPELLHALAQRLKKALGCGGTVEGTTVVLTGAQSDRVRAWLEAEGASRVIIGN